MLTKWLVIASIGCSCLLVPSISSAADTPPSTDIAKDMWFDQILPMLPPMVCKQFFNNPKLKQLSDDMKVTYEQCVTYIPAISVECKDKVYTQIPNTINTAAAQIWGRSLGECIGKSYAEKYLINKK